MNNDELIAAGHELAKCLDNEPLLDIAKMIVRLADKLDVTTLALREKTKQCEQLAAENAALKAGVKYFSYSEMAGFEEHSTADLAQKSADADLAGERDEASSEGWSEETDTICWGVILQKAVENKFEKPSEENGWIGWSDYALLPNIETPATDAFLRELRAQARKDGAHFVANRMLAAWDAGFIDDTAKNAADIARMILSSTEFMADAPEGDFDRAFADSVLVEIASELRKGGAA